MKKKVKKSKKKASKLAKAKKRLTKMRKVFKATKIKKKVIKATKATKPPHQIWWGGKARRPKKGRKITKAEKETKKKRVISEFQPKRAKIRIIGIGGGGSSIVSELSLRLSRVNFTVANTDRQALKEAKKKCQLFQFGESLTQGLGTGMRPELGEKAADSAQERIKKLLEGQDLVFLVSCLGGGTGSGAGPVFARISQEAKNLTFGIFTLPFEFEGSKRKEIANLALKKIKPYLNAYCIIPNEKIFQLIDKTTPLEQAFGAINKILIEALEGLIETIFLPGLINIDFADIKAILQGKERLAYLSSFQTQSKDFAEIPRAVLQNPIYDYRIKGAERILFNIFGSQSLTMSQVEAISSEISNFNPRAKIIFGISQSEKYKDKVKVTLLAVGCKEKEEKKKKIKPKKKEILAPPQAEPVARAEAEIPILAPVTLSESKKPKLKKKKKKLKLKKKISKIKKQVKKAILPKKKKLVSKKNKTVSKRKLKKSLPSQPEKAIIKEEVLPQEKPEMRIRRNGLELKKQAELAEKERWERESHWDIPAFLRRKVKS